MKKTILILIFALAGFTQAMAQKFAYIDSEYILQQMPEFRSAQKQLDAMAEEWQKDVEKRYTDIDRLYKAYEAEKVLLTDDMRKKREQEIQEKEKSVKDFQKQKFGYEGELFKKRQELVKPIQDRIFDAVQKIAKERAFDFIFDKSSDLIMLYTNAKYDVSDDVLDALGIVPGEQKDKQSPQPGGE